MQRVGLVVPVEQLRKQSDSQDRGAKDSGAKNNCAKGARTARFGRRAGITIALRHFPYLITCIMWGVRPAGLLSRGWRIAAVIARRLLVLALALRGLAAVEGG